MPESDEKTCPYCAETIKKAAIVCKHCGRDLAELLPRRSPPADDHLSEEMERRIERVERKAKSSHLFIIGGIAACIVGFIYDVGKTTMERMERERKSEYFELGRTIGQSSGNVESEVQERYLKLLQEFRPFPMSELGKKRIEEHVAIKKIDIASHEIWIDPEFWESLSENTKASLANDYCQYFMEFDKIGIPYCAIKSYSNAVILASMHGLIDSGTANVIFLAPISSSRFN